MHDSLNLEKQRLASSPRFIAVKSIPNGIVFSRLVEEGHVTVIDSDLAVNHLGTFYPHQDEAAHHMVAGAVVSLQRVLGEMGVLPRPSAVVMAVYPLPEGAKRGRLQFINDFGEFWFVGMPHEIINAGNPEDRYDTTSAFVAQTPYPRASPEKALCDWFWLANHTRQATWRNPPLDLDLDDIDLDQLGRIADAMLIKTHVDDWLVQYRSFQDDPEASEKATSRLRS